MLNIENTIIDFKLDSILLVDDNKSTNFFNKHFLSKKLPRVTFLTASNGEEALQKVNNSIDLIFLDINMPVMNGIEFLHQLNTMSFSSSKKPLVFIMMGTHIGDQIEQIKNIYNNAAVLNGKMFSETLFESIIPEIKKRYVL